LQREKNRRLDHVDPSGSLCNPRFSSSTFILRATFSARPISGDMAPRSSGIPGAIVLRAGTILLMMSRAIRNPKESVRHSVVAAKIG